MSGRTDDRARARVHTHLALEWQFNSIYRSGSMLTAVLRTLSKRVLHTGGSK